MVPGAGAMNITFVVPFGTRLANALTSYVTYVGKMLWPVHLAAFYPYREVVPTVSWASAGMVLTGITVLVIWAGRRRPYLVVGWLWYLVTLVPVIGLVQVGGQSMADRYTYIPLIGLFIMLVWGVSDLAARHRHGHHLLIGSAGVVIIGCMASTWLQVRHWQNGITVWAHALEVTKENAYAHSNYGAALAAQGKMNQAISHYRQTLRIVPRQIETRYKLARLLFEQGESDEALAHFQQLLKIYPGHSKAHNAIAVILDRGGRQDEALVHLREAARLDPNDADSQHNLGVVLAKQDKTDEAILHYKRAIEINPDYLDAHNKLAVLLARQGNREEAVAHFQEAVRLDPGSSELHRNLATALSDQGNIEEALLHYREAIRLNSKDPIPHNNLAWIRATHPNPKFRNGAEAVEFAEQACELVKEKNPSLLDTLAAAYAEAGRFPEAVARVEEAISLAASVGPGGLVPELERRLQGYRAGRPYREDEALHEEGDR